MISALEHVGKALWNIGNLCCECWGTLFNLGERCILEILFGSMSFSTAFDTVTIRQV